MRVVEIVRVDSRGRITMPSSLRDAMGIAEGMRVMLIGELDKKEIRIIPFADPEAKLIEISVTLSDVRGALAKVATILAKNKIDLLKSESRTLRRGKTAEWVVIADVSQSEISKDEICRKLVSSGLAKDAKWEKFL
jgi:AbrB family looped-hinge helix DNA binding protein